MKRFYRTGVLNYIQRMSTFGKIRRGMGIPEIRTSDVRDRAKGKTKQDDFPHQRLIMENEVRALECGGFK